MHEDVHPSHYHYNYCIVIAAVRLASLSGMIRNDVAGDF